MVWFIVITTKFSINSMLKIIMQAKQIKSSQKYSQLIFLWTSNLQFYFVFNREIKFIVIIFILTCENDENFLIKFSSNLHDPLPPVKVGKIYKLCFFSLTIRIVVILAQIQSKSRPILNKSKWLLIRMLFMAVF